MLQRNKTPVSYAAELTLKNVCHKYAENYSLKNINFHLKLGEVACLLGPSGCGKSTLLRLISGLECAYSGEIIINGKVICGENICVPTEKRNIGMVFQDYALFPHLSVLKNVSYGLQKIVSKSEADEEAFRALERVGLAEYAHKSPANLSGGERQRVALARSVVLRPSILLMDEPFSGLDGPMKETVRRETLQILREANVTTLMVTHDPEEAMRISDKILVMNKGEIVALGQAEDLYRNPPNLFTAKFLSEAVTQNIYLEENYFSSRFGNFKLKTRPAFNCYTLAVHPHDVKLSTSELIHHQKGKISQINFARDHFHYDIKLAESDEIVMVEGSVRVPVGQNVWLSVDAHNIMLFDPEAELLQKIPLQYMG